MEKHGPAKKNSLRDLSTLRLLPNKIPFYEHTCHNKLQVTDAKAPKKGAQMNNTFYTIQETKQRTHFPF